MNFGRYEIKGELGEGGMGKVYHCYDPYFDRDVAIKTLSRSLVADEVSHARFTREARTIGRLSHPSIIPVYDFGEHDGQPFLVMAYMGGGSLETVIEAEGAISPDDALEILRRVAEALDAAHEQGIIHRDVKPANILFNEEGYAFLSDFGIVKLNRESTKLTATQAAIGTPYYMAPEMMEDDPLTKLIDIYALGVTMYEALTGQRPFNAETPRGVIIAHMVKEVPDLREMRSELPSGITAVIRKAMAKDPAERYQSGAEMARDFEQALRSPSAPINEDIPQSTVQVDTQPKPPTEETKPSNRNSWIGAAVGVGLVALLLIGAAVVGLGLLSGDGNGDKAEATATEQEVAVVDDPTATITPTMEDPPTEAPTDTPAPTDPEATVTPAPTDPPEPTVNPVLTLAQSGDIDTNDEWTPYIQTFQGAEMALVPAGCYNMGSERFATDSDPDESPIVRVCFDEPFWIDIYEVTNGQFGEPAPGCVFRSGDDDQPRVCIPWQRSADHCTARGARLPTEAEWEYAARGPDELIYPWGDQFRFDRVAFISGSSQPTYAVGTVPEGTSWVGAFDMSGNVYEWMQDWYDEGYYSELSENTERIVDPQGPETGIFRSVRGGNFVSFTSDLRAANRYRYPVDTAEYILGFRCARDFMPGDLDQ